MVRNHGQDAMDSRDLEQTEEGLNSRKLRSYTGTILVTMGIAGVLWIVERIIALGSGPQDIPLIAKFLAFDTAGRTIGTPSGNFVLPEGLYFAVGFFLYLMVLGVIATLTKALIAAGVNLLGPDVSAATNRLQGEIGRLRTFLENRIK